MRKQIKPSTRLPLAEHISKNFGDLSNENSPSIFIRQEVTLYQLIKEGSAVGFVLKPGSEGNPPLGWGSVQASHVFLAVNPV